jgi:hypothetical protein
MSSSFYAHAMLLFCIMKELLYQSFLFSENILQYITEWPFASGASVEPTSQVSSYVILVLPNVEH